MNITGTGSITQLDKTKSPYRCRKWMLQVRTTKGRKSIRFTGSKAEARVALDNFMSKLENEEYFQKKYFTSYSKYWYSYRQKSGRYSPNTLETDLKYVKKLNSLYENYTLSQLTPQLIRDSFINVKYNNKSDKELSGTTKNHMFFTLNAILNMAVSDDLIPKNPCKAVNAPSKDTRKKRALSMKELKYLHSCLEKEPMDGKVMLIYLLSMLGLRRQEAVCLTWKDYNKTKKKISINKAYKASTHEIGKTKSKSSNRTLPVPKKLAEVLDKWKKVCEENLITSEYICCTPSGGLMRGESYYEWWKEIKKKYNIPDITLHELRHTNFTIMAQHMNHFALRDYAGWADLSPTSIYIHDNQDLMKSAVEKVDF